LLIHIAMYTLSMAEKTGSMLKRSLDALVNLDSDLAQKVRLKDDEVDDETRLIYDKIKEAIRSQPQLVGYMVNFFLLSCHLERIADLANNIAEEVIYLTEEEILRHRIKKTVSDSHELPDRKG
jgi:phosphate transport system protein